MLGAGVDWINRKLVENYGKDLYGNATYRVVYSSSQRENRYGTFEVKTESGIFLRTETCWKEVPKYPLFPDMWVFEKIQENYGQNPEIQKGMTYEPIWFFRDAKGEKVQPEWWACEAIVQADRAVKKMQLSPDDFQAAEDLRMAREKMVCKDIIQNESPYLAGALRDGSAIAVPSNYEKSNEKV